MSPNPDCKRFRCSLEDTGTCVAFSSPRVGEWTCARVAGAAGGPVHLWGPTAMTSLQRFSSLCHVCAWNNSRFIFHQWELPAESGDKPWLLLGVVSFWLLSPVDVVDLCPELLLVFVSLLPSPSPERRE